VFSLCQKEANEVSRIMMTHLTLNDVKVALDAENSPLWNVDW